MADIGLNEIESAAIARVKSLWPAGAKPIVEFDITANPQNIATPGIYAAAECTGFRKVNKDSWVKLVALRIYLIFGELSGPGSRRAGAHKLALAIEQILIAQKLGLDMQPLEPVKSPEITDSELRAMLKLGFRIDLKTEIDIHALPEAQVADFLKLTVTNYLCSGNDTATDVITLQ